MAVVSAPVQRGGQQAAAGGEGPKPGAEGGQLEADQLSATSATAPVKVAHVLPRSAAQGAGGRYNMLASASGSHRSTEADGSGLRGGAPARHPGAALVASNGSMSSSLVADQ